MRIRRIWKSVAPAALTLLFALASGAQTLTRTRVQDVLFNADGSRANGRATVSWKSFTASGGATVTANSIDVKIVQGLLGVDLTPNDGAQPTGTSYRVEYAFENGNRSTETWIVPASASAVTVAAVRIGQAPTAGTVIAQSQVSGLADDLDTKADTDGSNTFSQPQTIREDAPGATNPMLRFEKNDGAHYIGFRLPNLAESTEYALPNSDGLPGTQLTTDGLGSLFWSAAGAGADPGTAYEILQQDGSSMVQRNVANFMNGFQLSDNVGATRTDIEPMYGTTAGTVTEGDDPRLSDARTPLAHAASHATAGADPMDPVAIGALKRTNDVMVGTLLNEPVLKLQSITGQSAPVQEWRDGNGDLLSLITPSGSAFFREMGISAKLGSTVVSQFFQVDGKNRFAFSAVPGVFDVIRYDDSGSFKDRPFRIFRDGNITTGVGLEISDATVGSGTIKLFGDYAELKAVAAPSNPAATGARLFLDTSSGEVSVRKPSGAIVSLEQDAGRGSFGVFTDAETPAGTIDGVNAIFTLTGAPTPPASLTLTRNGIVQEQGVQYLLSGSTATFQPGSIPQGGDSLLAWYRTSSSTSGGDLTGDYPNPLVSGLQGRGLASTAPSDGECLAWNATGSEWEPSVCDATMPSNAGGGAEVLKTATNVEARTLTSGTGVMVSEGIDEIAIALNPGEAPLLGVNNVFSGDNDYSLGRLRLPNSSGAPAAGDCTAGSVGREYVDSDNGGVLYWCLQSAPGVYTWTAGQTDDATLPVNAGTGFGILKTGTNVEAKSLTAGDGISILSTADELTVELDDSGVARLDLDNIYTGDNDISTGRLRLPSAAGAPLAGDCTAATVGRIQADNADGGAQYTCLQRGAATYEWVAIVGQEVSSTANFGGADRLVRSAGASREVVDSGVTVDASDNVTVPGSMSVGKLFVPRGSGAPLSGCDGPNAGTLYVDVDNGGKAYVCLQTGAASYSWSAFGSARRSRYFAAATTDAAGGADFASGWAAAANGPAADASGSGAYRVSQLSFADSDTDAANLHWRIPADWDGGTVSLEIEWRGDATASDAEQAEWEIATACTADGEDIEAPTFNTAQVLLATFNTGDDVNLNQETLASVTMTGCAPGEYMALQIVRDGVSDNLTGAARLLGLSLGWSE